VKKIVVRVLVVAAALVAAAFGVRAFMVWDRTRDVLPEFSPVPPGPRAPSVTLLGVEPGKTRFADVQALTTSLGYACRDTSMRGLMKQGREDVQKKMAEAKAAGEDPDTVSGASRAYYYSKKERNPQVQWSCEDVDVSRVPGAGYDAEPRTTLSFVFDSEELPLRYVMVSRKFTSQSAAVAARDASLARFAFLGAPTTSVGAPNLDPSQKAFERLHPVSTEWAFADRRVTVSVMNFGPQKGIDVREIVEIPWPVTTTPER
jgi:hypothetical protein